jgi:hypothetical protein
MKSEYVNLVEETSKIKDKLILDTEALLDRLFEGDPGNVPENLNIIAKGVQNMLPPIDDFSQLHIEPWGGGGGGDLLKGIDLIPGQDPFETLTAKMFQGPAEIVTKGKEVADATGLSWIAQQIKDGIIEVINWGWEWFTSLAGQFWEFLTENFYYFLTTYWLEITIAAIVAAALAWLAFKVKRWWDGTTAVISQVKKSQKQIEKKIEGYKNELDKRVDSEHDPKIKSHMEKVFEKIGEISKQKKEEITSKLEKLPKDPKAVMALVAYITNLKVDENEIKKVSSQLKVA